MQLFFFFCNRKFLYIIQNSKLTKNFFVLRQANKLQPYTDVTHIPLDWLFRKHFIKASEVHYMLFINLAVLINIFNFDYSYISVFFYDYCYCCCWRATLFVQCYRKCKSQKILQINILIINFKLFYLFSLLFFFNSI